ncbi:MAG TPA: hypothetical protein VJN88_02385 [Ktedonobacterales bacterium]|nr:hypothetical protein [Ktedonobacterales bacterium]
MRARFTAHVDTPHVPRPAPATVREPPRRTSGGVICALVVLTAVWGVVVDAAFIPLLAPTHNSTIFQASTAASFATLGVLFGPGIGALAGILRDTIIYIEQVIADPTTNLHAGVSHYIIRWLIDALEDAILGFLPGLVARRTRRLSLIAAASALAAWVSLPLLVIGNTLNDGQPARVWHALTTKIGDWDEPVDPGLTVYALLTAALVATILANWTTRPRRALVIAFAWLAVAVALMVLGGHT